MANRRSNGNEGGVIPESILSVAKDGRYVQQCQELLLKFISFLFERKESNNQERNPELQQVQKQTTWVISCIIYMLVSAKVGRTLGMEALGLHFDTDNNVATKPQSDEMTRMRHRRFLFLCISMLSAATGSLLLEYFTNGSTESANNDQLDGGDQERSRGRERRLIHERLRRQMLERAANLGGTPAASGGSNISNPQTQQQTDSRRDNTALTTSTTTFSLSERFLTVFRQLSKVRRFPVYSIPVHGIRESLNSIQVFKMGNPTHRV